MHRVTAQALGRETAPHTWTTDARGIRRFPKSVCAWPIFHNRMRLRELQIIRQKVPDDPPSCPKSGQARYLPAKCRASRWCDRAIVSSSVRTFAIRGFFREARRRRFVLSRNLSFWCGKPADISHARWLRFREGHCQRPVSNSPPREPRIRCGHEGLKYARSE